VIGVTTAIISPSGSNAGIGFAIPVDIVNRVVPELIGKGRVPTPGIGIMTANETVATRLPSMRRRFLNRTASGFSFATPGIDRLRDRTPEQLKAAAADTVQAFKLTVDFLYDQLHIPNSTVIPYINQVVVIAEVFRRKPALTAKELMRLREWFWRTTLTSYFSGWNSGQMDTDREAVARFVGGQSDSLDMGVVRPHSSIWSSKAFRANNAHSKMLGLMLTHTRPLDLISGQKLDLKEALAWQNSKEYHHIFPRAFLVAKGCQPNKINALCNFALISSSSNKLISDMNPSVYFRECASRLGEDFQSVLVSNLISDTAFKAALADDFDAFSSARAATLSDYANELCGWN
jgi:hypothetical protein